MGQGEDGVYIYFGAVVGGHGEGVFWGAGRGRWGAAVGGVNFSVGLSIVGEVFMLAGGWALGYYL